MPVADFPGERNWGYDGVMLYAPSRAYGSPNDFRALVDAAIDAVWPSFSMLFIIILDRTGIISAPLATLIEIPLTRPPGAHRSICRSPPFVICSFPIRITGCASFTSMVFASMRLIRFTIARKSICFPILPTRFTSEADLWWPRTIGTIPP